MMPVERDTVWLLSKMVERKHLVFTRPYQINIVGVRCNSTKSNSFDDAIHVFYYDEKGKIQHVSYLATTDPGTFWLKNPMKEQGTAILKEGQYVNAYKIGLHRGLYKALVQTGTVVVVRDYDRDARLDFNNGRLERGQGINIHRAEKTGTTLEVDKFSAGCQVFANAEEFASFIQLCEKHQMLYGNYFTYTLIDERAIARERKRKLAYGAGCIALTGLTYTITRKFLFYE